MMQCAELVSVITAAAVAIAQGRTIEELETLATVFTQLGDTIATIAVQQTHKDTYCDSLKNKNI